MMDMYGAKLKKDNLIRYIRKFPSILIAFSGGVDSTFLLAVAHQVLGDNAVAATAFSGAHPSRERDAAVLFTKERGIFHIVFKSDETDLPEFIANSRYRCYYCKKYISQHLKDIAEKRGISKVAHGANMDDLGDFRPGLKAADEEGVISPLIEAKLGKEEIRFLSREMNLPSWDKPSMACLASRIPYGSKVTPEKLKMIENAEEFLLQSGFSQFRVRHHGTVARIEVEESAIPVFAEKALRENISEYFKKIGFSYITLDLQGYVSGSMNRELEEAKDPKNSNQI